jgi:hypothetical protein
MSSKESPELNPVLPMLESITPEPLSLKEMPDTAPLQFETAEYAHQADDRKCGQCNQQMMDRYYKLNGRRICSSCLESKKASASKSDVNFYKALFFGFGAAFAGLILYSTFEIVTGWVIGYLSLAVGYIIAKAMLKGSGGVGSRKLQIAAALLTYGAVSLAAIPVSIHQFSKEKGKAVVQAERKSKDESSAPVVSTKPAGSKHPGLLSSLGILLFIGLASPFLELSGGFSGIIGLVILFVGINIAWKNTKGIELQILGPFTLNAKEAQ